MLGICIVLPGHTWCRFWGGLQFEVDPAILPNPPHTHQGEQSPQLKYFAVGFSPGNSSCNRNDCQLGHFKQNTTHIKSVVSKIKHVSECKSEGILHTCLHPTEPSDPGPWMDPHAQSNASNQDPGNHVWRERCVPPPVSPPVPVSPAPWLPAPSPAAGACRATPNSGWDNDSSPEFSWRKSSSDHSLPPLLSSLRVAGETLSPIHARTVERIIPCRRWNPPAYLAASARQKQGNTPRTLRLE